MERFIEAVRKYPCLWNTTAIEYRDQELKDAAWVEVTRETDLPSVKEVKQKWKKLRDSYRDALKRQNEMLAKDPGSLAKKVYPWKYMELMQFLQPYMSNRKKPGEGCGLGASYAGITAAEGATGGNPSTGIRNGDARSSSSSESEAESEARRCDRLELIDRKLEYLCRARPALSPGGPPAAKRSRGLAVEPPPPDPLDIFFNSMCQSTKRFPFAAQIKIKKTLFSAVIEAEEALVSEQHNYASLWARAPGSSSSSEPDDDDRKPA